jgi:hypothetical protein
MGLQTGHFQERASDRKQESYWRVRVSNYEVLEVDGPIGRVRARIHDVG